MLFILTKAFFPDGKLLDRDVIKEEVFFKKINYFFDKVEKITGKKVVIAASPKHLYRGFEYSGREIVYNRTAELAYYCDLAIAHTTAAVHFAVAAYKPILFLRFQEFNEFLVEEAEVLASALNKKILNIEEDFDVAKLEDFSRVDREIYKSYIDNYMAREVFEVSPAEIMVEALKKCDGI